MYTMLNVRRLSKSVKMEKDKPKESKINIYKCVLFIEQLSKDKMNRATGNYFSLPQQQLHYLPQI